MKVGQYYFCILFSSLQTETTNGSVHVWDMSYSDFFNFSNKNSTLIGIASTVVFLISSFSRLNEVNTTPASLGFVN